MKWKIQFDISEQKLKFLILKMILQKNEINVVLIFRDIEPAIV